MRLLFLSLMTAVSFGLVSATAMATPKNAGYVPQDWFVLPEDSGAENFAGPSALTEGNDNLSNSLKRIFGAQRDALSSVKAPAVPMGAPSDKPKDWVPWRFAFFASDLTLSASGLIGVLGFKGSPSVTVYWMKKEGQAKEQLKEEPKMSLSESTKDAPSFFIDETASKTQMAKQVDAIHRTVVASGRVKNTKGLRSELTKTVNRFHEMTKVVSASPSDVEWYPSRLRLDVQVSATGRVKWGTVGGDVKVRLEWFRIQGPAHKTAPLVAAKFTNTQSGLRDLIGAVSEDLVAATAMVPAPHFWANDFNIGLGITAKGNVGIAKGSASAFGYVYFTHVKKEKTRPGFVENAVANRFDKASWYLIDSNPNPAHEEFARKNGIEVVKEEQFVNSDVAAMYKINREHFRTGLKRAFGIGNYFSAQAAQVKANDWNIQAVKPGFAISIGGDVGLVSLTGSVSATITFVNKNF